VHLLNPRPIHPAADLKKRENLFGKFLGVRLDDFLKKFQQLAAYKGAKSTKDLMSFSLVFVCFIAFLGVSQRWEKKNPPKSPFTKNKKIASESGKCQPKT
jgi:hypothetical protein